MKLFGKKANGLKLSMRAYSVHCGCWCSSNGHPQYGDHYNNLD